MILKENKEHEFLIIMDKSFVIVLIAIAIIGFSSSAYIFSENQIIKNIEMPSIFSSDRTEYINKINKCLDENTIVDDSIALNSFTTTLLHDLKVRAQATESIDELEDILEQVYNTTTCKP